MHWGYLGGLLCIIALCIYFSLTRHKQYLTDLATHALQVENINQISKRKQFFISKISHDLRTPLHGINGLIELLGKEKLSESGQVYLDKLKIGSKALLEVISGVIELNRPDDSDITVEKEPLDLSQLSEELVQLYSTNCYLKNIQLSLFIEPSIYNKIYFLDRNKINQILTNLLSNAIKFTDSGEVTLWLKESPLDDTACKITFMITDTGTGIPEENLPFLTQPYYQVSEIQENRIKGAGLGLNICLTLLKSMRSSLSITSKVGVGSQFSFSLTADTTSKLHIPTVEMKDHKKIVLLSPKSVTTENIINFLAFWSIDCEYLESDAIDDLTLPVDLLIIQGFTENQLTKLIPRVRSMDISSIHILLDIDTKAIEQQFSDIHLHYHYGYFSASVLHNILNDADVVVQHLSNSHPQIDYLTLLKECTAEHDCAMLVVDDNEINQLVLSEMLHEVGITKIDVANNGQEAVDFALQNDYDVIWMDLMMPIMDGLEATQKILEQQPNTVIYGLSATTEIEHLEKCQQVGMQTLFAKPLNKADLHTLLLAYFEDKIYPSDHVQNMDLAQFFNQQKTIKILIHSIDNKTIYKLNRYFSQQKNVFISYFYAPQSIIYHCQVEAFDLLLVDINDSQLPISAFMHEYSVKRQKTPIILVNAGQKIYLDKSNEKVHCLPLNFTALDIQKILERFKEESTMVYQHKPTLPIRDHRHG